RGTHFRSIGRCVCDAFPLTRSSSCATGNHDSHCSYRFQEICADGTVRHHYSGWRPRRLSALCRFCFGTSVWKRRIRAALGCCLVSGHSCRFFWGDFSLVQGGRLVRGALAANRRSARRLHLWGATALICILAYVPFTESSFAQSIDLAEAAGVSTNGEMLLEADTIVYDNDQATVTAI